MKTDNWPEVLRVGETQVIPVELLCGEPLNPEVTVMRPDGSILIPKAAASTIGSTMQLSYSPTSEHVGTVCILFEYTFGLDHLMHRVDCTVVEV